MSDQSSIDQEVTRIETNVSDSFSAVEEMGGTVPEGATSDNLPGSIRSIPTGAGVSTFNGRSGAVVPETGDYTPAQVGAAPANHEHDTRYFQRSETMSREQIEEAIAAVKEEGGYTRIYLAEPADVSVTNTDEGAKICWTDPANVTMPDSSGVLAAWGGTVVVRKVGSAPTSKTDGVIVVDSKVRDQYKTNGYQDTGLVNGTTYYYGIFPYSTDGVYTVSTVKTFTPSPILPAAATNVTLTNLDEAVQVSFTRPDGIDSVKVVYGTTEPADITDGTAVSASSSPVTISDLTNGTTYYFKVFTVAGKRNAASAVKSLAPTAIYPSAPTGVTIENLIKSARISYTKPGDATSIKVVYKAGSAPTSPDDGTAVTATSSPVTISGLVTGTKYYFVVFALNAKRYKASTAVSVTAREAEHYAFTINDNEQACKSKITYPAGVDNSAFAAAGISGGTFSYGGWANAFFIKKLKIVMLNFDGTEAYEIDKNNYKQKAAGGTVGTEGNVMSAIPKVYYKVVDNGDGTFTYHFSDVALDADYKCWAHIGIDGAEKDYFYTAVYDPCLEGGKLRSLTGKAPSVNQNAQTEINEAVANNPGSKKNWYTGVLADRKLIELLLLLIGKNTNTQEQFGAGRTASANSNAVNSGTMDDKGLFWGDTGGVNGVKVFGIEHFWGNVWNRIAGWMCVGTKQKVKMTYGKQDGSTVEGYNTDGSGYIDLGTLPTSSFWIKTMLKHKFGLLPQAGEASATTGYADYCYLTSSGTYYAYVGGHWSYTTHAGAFCVDLNHAVSASSAAFGASLSYKQG